MLARSLRLIPTRTAMGNGMLTAIVPDSLIVIDGRGRHPSDDLIAPAELHKRAFGFDALMPFE